MTDETDDKLVEVRTFASIDEIRSVKGFKEDNPVSKENYDCIIGDYWFPDEVKCCRDKLNGQLCGEAHKWGFVAKLRDGTITIVGNKCARDKFGADAKIKADRSRYIREKTRREKFIQLGELLAEKEARIGRLVVAEGSLKRIQERVSRFLAPLGERTRRRLQDMARSASPMVFVNAVTYREYVDEEGNKKQERRTAPEKLGSFNGLACVNDGSFPPLYKSLETIREGMDAASAATEDIKTSKLELLVATINDLDRVEGEVARLKREENLFFANDFSLLCFLTDDKPERYKAARAHLEHSGEAVGKDKAKDWLAEREQELKKLLHADKIEIQY
jgi:hypothetical protein